MSGEAAVGVALLTAICGVVVPILTPPCRAHYADPCGDPCRIGPDLGPGDRG